jgi:ankyrin repeat protein
VYSGAAVNAVNSSGQTALHLAYSLTALLQSTINNRNEWCLMKLLMELGSDMKIRDNNGDTADQLLDTVTRNASQRTQAAEERARHEREEKDKERERKRNERADKERDKELLLLVKVSSELRDWLHEHNIDDTATLLLAKRDVFNLTQLRAVCNI